MMKTICDDQLLDKYIKKYALDTIFTDFAFWRQRMTLVEFPKKSLIAYTDESRTCLAFVVKGRFNVYGSLSNGKQILYRFCKAFMFLGEMELLEDSQPLMQMNCVAEDMCHVILCDYTHYGDKLLEDTKFLKFLCMTFAEKMKTFGTMQAVNSLQSADAKVASYILNAIGPDGIWSENLRIVSECLNISYRHLHRVLKRFVDDGVICHEVQCYRVVNRKVLEDCAKADM